MTRKDYIAIAQAISRAYHKDIQAVIEELVIVLKRDNYRFNRERFINFIHTYGKEKTVNQ